MKWVLTLAVLVAVATAAPMAVPAAFQDYMISLTNYAAWDDSLTLMFYPTQSNVQNYITLNLPPNVMRNMPVNFVGYYFPNGTSLILLGYNYTSLTTSGVASNLTLPTNFTTVPANIVSLLSSSIDARYTDTWIYPTNNRPYMVAGCPIFHSDYTAPLGGFVLFGLFQDLLPTHSQYLMNYAVNLAAWDTSYNLMANKSDDAKIDFLGSTFPFATMKNNLINFAAYYFTDGTNFFTIGYDFTASNPYNPLVAPDLFVTVPSAVISAMQDPNYRYTTTVAYSNWNLDVVGVPIAHTSGAGPVNGFSLFGRFQDTSTPLKPISNFAPIHGVGLFPLLIAIACFLLY